MKNLKLTTGLLALLSLTLAKPVLAQDSKSLSLDEAVVLSLKNSKQIKLNLARINEATAVLKQAEDNKLPEVSVSGSGLYLPKPTINLNESLKGNGGGTGGGTTPKEMPEVHSAFYAMVNVSQPIFTGFKIKSGIESARYLATAVKLDSEFDREAIIENTVEAYINLFKADAGIAVLKETLGESIQRVKDYTSMEKNGILARNDLLKAQLEVSNFELALLEGEKDRKLANVNMNIMLGLPENTQLVTTMPTGIVAADKALPDWEMLAGQNRKDIAALKEREKASVAGITAAKGDLYPSIAATGGYIAANIPGIISIPSAVNVGVGVKYNVSSIWKTKAKVSQAEAYQQQIVISQAALNDHITMELHKAYEESVLSTKKIAVLEVAVEQAKENYRIINNKFNNSIATTQEVLDANVAKLRAQLNFEFAKADAQVSNFKLAEAAGIISTKFSTINN